MKLSPQKLKLYELFKDRGWHCSVEITPLYIRDYRKRLSEMLREGFVFESATCTGVCEIKHNSNIHMYRLADEPKKEEQVFYTTHPITGERITTKEFSEL